MLYNKGTIGNDRIYVLSNQERGSVNNKIIGTKRLNYNLNWNGTSAQGGIHKYLDNRMITSLGNTEGKTLK